MVGIWSQFSPRTVAVWLALAAQVYAVWSPPFSVAEEFIIQQTSLAPLPFIGANAAYGRLWGVNWVYFLFLLGFESLWVVMVPVQITELCFPRHRHQPWLRKRGLTDYLQYLPALAAALRFGTFDGLNTH